MTLGRRLTLVVLAFVVLTAAAAVTVALTIRARGAHSADMRRYAVTAEGVARLRAAYTDMETEQRGFVITGSQVFLAPFENGSRTAQSLLDAMRERHPDDPRLRAELDEVAAAGERWLTVSALPEIEARRNSGLEAAESLVATGQGRVLFDALRTLLDRLEAVAGERFGTAEASDQRLRRQQTAVLIVTLVAVATLLVAAFLALRRWVTSPLIRITDAVQNVSAGDLRHPIPVVGPADIRRLAANVDQMRQRMVAEIDRADRARQAIEQSASMVLEVQAVLTADPSDVPEGWSVAGGLEAAEGLVAGDCHDLFRLGDDRLAVLVLDIAGHGASAALTALRCKEIVRASLRAQGEPGAAFTALDQLTDDLEPDMFVTGFVAVIDRYTGRVRYANAGHPPALIRDGAELVALDPTGPVVGPFTGTWRTETTTVVPGAQLIVYTDGIPEARGQGDFFGSQRLAEVVASGPSQAAALVTELLKRAKEHAEGQLADDATALVISRDDGRGGPG